MKTNLQDYKGLPLSEAREKAEKDGFKRITTDKMINTMEIADDRIIMYLDDKNKVKQAIAQ